MPPKKIKSSQPCSTCVVRRHGFCNLLDTHSLNALLKSATRLTLKPKTHIHLDSSQKRTVIVSSGAVKAFTHLKDGREQILRFMYANDMWNLALTADKNNATEYCVETLQRTTLCVVPTATLTRLCQDNPALIKYQENVLQKEVSHLRRHITRLGQKTTTERVASCLLELYELQKSPHVPEKNGKVRILVPMSRSDLADYLGMKIETVSRALSVFRKKGILENDGTSAVWVNLDGITNESAGRAVLI